MLVVIGQPAVEQDDRDIGLLQLPDEISSDHHLARGWTPIESLGRREDDAVQAVRAVDEGAQDVLLAAKILAMRAQNEVVGRTGMDRQVRDDTRPEAAEYNPSDGDRQVRPLGPRPHGVETKVGGRQLMNFRERESLLVMQGLQQPGDLLRIGEGATGQRFDSGHDGVPARARVADASSEFTLRETPGVTIVLEQPPELFASGHRPSPC